MCDPIPGYDAWKLREPPEAPEPRTEACPRCEGAGFDDDDEPCPVCEGAGEVCRCGAMLAGDGACPACDPEE